MIWRVIADKILKPWSKSIQRNLLPSTKLNQLPLEGKRNLKLMGSWTSKQWIHLKVSELVLSQFQLLLLKTLNKWWEPTRRKREILRKWKSNFLLWRPSLFRFSKSMVSWKKSFLQQTGSLLKQKSSWSKFNFESNKKTALYLKSNYPSRMKN